jgi:hypothetical protein
MYKDGCANPNAVTDAGVDQVAQGSCSKAADCYDWTASASTTIHACVNVWVYAFVAALLAVVHVVAY